MPTFRPCYVQISTTGAAWTDLTDSASVEIPAGAGQRPTSTLHQYGVDTPIVVAAKHRTPIRLVITYNYADAARDETIRAAYEAGSAFYIRFAPRGNATGNYLYTSAAGVITTPPIPEGQQHSGAVVLNRFTFETGKLTKYTLGVDA